MCIQTKLLKVATVMLEKDKEQKKQEREATLSERLPPLKLSGLNVQDLQVCTGHRHEFVPAARNHPSDV